MYQKAALWVQILPSTGCTERRYYCHRMGVVVCIGAMCHVHIVQAEWRVQCRWFMGKILIPSK